MKLLIKFISATGMSSFMVIATVVNWIMTKIVIPIMISICIGIVLFVWLLTFPFWWVTYVYWAITGKVPAKESYYRLTKHNGDKEDDDNG